MQQRFRKIGTYVEEYKGKENTEVSPTTIIRYAEVLFEILVCRAIWAISACGGRHWVREVPSNNVDEGLEILATCEAVRWVDLDKLYRGASYVQATNH